ncbi:6-phosphogluconate dehydrogenase [Bradyrhizobium sp. SSBR45G]|uniref:NAD(P)-dependent oxidoreductase n=1 Tax=unclassified Bradyrhizobium TaxID=2631580 RepID=UPI0023429D1F|nr:MULTISPECIES: NAD(P)-dependent oxidoreductase [unclassified Bradyrhizobium]GLH75427.1 6-phosphogluconate dehydrogenase [Bradyrhizobium sp. SSBR45G]GLH82786.1 6-phosphogluconate dehydrogenase [Bradyrhizobium sp. SSBR45R]
MPPSIAVIAPGAMGSAIAARLVEHGCKVLTLLEGRSAATRARAAASGMVGASESEIANADIILSIVPPGEAVALAEQLATVINRNAKKPVIVDCNAVNVETIRRIEDIVLSSGARLVDAAIIGLPPKPGAKGPALYVSGDAAADVSVLGQLGLDLRRIEGPIGAASALKMSYAGINKGLTGLGAAMVLAATRAGAADALRDELALSLPHVQARLANSLPDMLPKAYRWVAEMREIAGFLGPDHPAALIYEGFARLFEHIATDVQGQGTDAAQLVAFAESCKAK